VEILPSASERIAKPELPIKVDVILGSELTASDRQVWSALQESNRALSSPYFCPEFTALVSEVRDDVRIGVLSDRGRVVGFFPFQSDGRGTGEPLAEPGGDFHGVVATPATHWDPIQLLRGCGLKAWDFHGLPVDQEPFRPYHKTTYPSLCIDLASGYQAYVQKRRDVGTRQIVQVNSSRRKLERDLGEIQFVMHTDDSRALVRLGEWKTARIRARGERDAFSNPMLSALRESLCGVQTDGFAGMLSALYAGDELVALHLGMRSRLAWHYWFPAYNPRFAKYQPGLILLLEFARAASSLGSVRIDFGAGDEAYKHRLASGATELAQGRVALL
jgi:CelD/BcsL family acetyltransferase involved in cellulose biosynthesis